MAADTFATMWRSLQAWCPVASPALCQRLIRDRFRAVHRKRVWSWRVGEGQFLFPAVYSTGTVTTVYNSKTVTGVGTGWTSALAGRQFRAGTSPIYTIDSVDSTTQLTLDQAFGDPGAAGISYTIFQAYVTVPSDFHDFIVVRDIQYNWRLHLHLSWEYLNSVDAQRAYIGTPWVVADFRYGTTPSSGSVAQPVQVVGSGPAPTSLGTYTGRTQSTFVITVTTGGVTGTAVFSWRKDGGTTTAGIVTTAAPFEMTEGVNVQWPTGNTYVLNDVFIVNVTPGLNVSLPMYEFWPHQQSQRVYPYLYFRKMPDLDDVGGALPRYIDGDVLVRGALADLARWPGVSGTPNPMFNLTLANSYEGEFQKKVAEMEREDDDVFETDIRFQGIESMSWAPFPFPQVMGADWAQAHDVPSYYAY